MARPSDARLLEDLRRWRRTPAPDLSLGEAMARQARGFRRAGRELGGLARIWTEVVPPELADGCRLVGVSRGVLTVAVADSGRLFKLDRFLRAGGQMKIIRRAPAALNSVRLRLATG
ncbi:MAG: DUF721 domain-containing protein [Phycisphaerae bacterium]|nr:DUF721 domain-containing protein [Phycisphaerae bacterium]